MSKQQQVGLMLISTGKYKQFVPKLLEEIKKYFLPEHKVKVFIFNDEYNMGYEGNERVKIEQHPIPSYKFPYATLYRFKIFHQHRYQLSKMDYLFYSDVDMSFCATIGNEILNDGLTVVYHPGFYSKKDEVGHWGSNGVVRESLAWVEPEKRFGYVAGGFSGGKTEVYLEMAKVLDQRITEDESKGVIAEWNDESHLNFFLKKYYLGDVLYLNPSYCLVEQPHLRQAWGLSELEPKIVALAKDHAKIRE